MSQLPLFLAVWNILSVVESTTIDPCTDLGPVAQPERCRWCYGVTLVEDDYQFLASLRHNGGHLWRTTTIYYGFSTSPTSHCTACAEYSSSPTQLSTYQSQKPPERSMVQKDATTLNFFFRKWSQIGGYALKNHGDLIVLIFRSQIRSLWRQLVFTMTK